MICDSAGKALRMSEDHKPNRADERERVEKAGGQSILMNKTWRVATPPARTRLLPLPLPAK